MKYDLSDFVETVEIAAEREGFDPKNIQRCVAAWGEQGSYAEWEGGFLLELRDGRYAYLSGWCDTTGWGCQDGVEVRYFPNEISLDGVRAAEMSSKEEWETFPPLSAGWTIDPADCNRWLKGEVNRFDEELRS